MGGRVRGGTWDEGGRGCGCVVGGGGWFCEGIGSSLLLSLSPSRHIEEYSHWDYDSSTLTLKGLMLNADSDKGDVFCLLIEVIYRIVTCCVESVACDAFDLQVIFDLGKMKMIQALLIYKPIGWSYNWNKELMIQNSLIFSINSSYLIRKMLNIEWKKPPKDEDSLMLFFFFI